MFLQSICWMNTDEVIALIETRPCFIQWIASLKTSQRTSLNITP